MRSNSERLDKQHMSNYSREALGHAIKDALTRSGVRKVDIQKATGTTWPTVNNWCTGKHSPPFDALVAIAELTGVPLGEIVSAGIPDASRSPYEAWAEFLLTDDAKMAQPWMLEQLGAFRTPAGKVPTVETYRRTLFAMLSVEGEQHDE